MGLCYCHYMSQVFRIMPALMLVSIPTLAETISEPATFTQNSSTQGTAMVAESPAGPLGLRFSGGLIIDTERSDAQFGQSDLENASPYLGIGVMQRHGNMDFSADLGFVQRERCATEDCTATSVSTAGPETDTQPVLNLGFRLRF